MCGITGFVSAENAALKEQRLRRMTDVIAHRGPDAEGYRTDGSVALGHRRLSIVDIQGGSQPMCNETGDIWVVFNGEIYNHSALRAELADRGHVFRTRSDTEVLVHLYEEYGEQLAVRLDGMFSFAIWDERRRRLYAARDPVGIKPFYWARVSGGFYFASEVKSILAAGVVARDVDIPALRDYLTLSYPIDDSTFFLGIKSLEPGHALMWSDGNLRVWPYWEPVAEKDVLSESAWVDRLGRTLSASVQSHLMGDVPVGAHLSGGVDSSAVVAYARPHSPELHTFSIGHPDYPDLDESAAAQQVARLFGTQHHMDSFTEEDVIRDLPRMIWHLDQPVAGAGLIPNFYVSRLASNHVKVVLGGQGGDELFAGYARHVLFSGLGNLIRGTVALAAGRLRRNGGQITANVQKQADRLNLVSALRTVSSIGVPVLERYYRHGQLWDDTVLLAGSTAPSPFEKLASLAQGFQGDVPLDQLLYLDLKTYLRGYLHLEDRMSMAWSLESRVPLLAKSVLEDAFRMPAKYKVRGLTTKYLYKRTVSGQVPAEILNKRKLGFPVPVRQWLDGRLGLFAREILLSERAVQRGILDPARISALLDTPPGLRDRTWDRRVWSALSVELWCRSYLDRIDIREPEELGALDPGVKNPF